ncbi:hypothetical protein TNCV_4608861 [Trichonephila clavipes]|nr:hypothetical protein TNCV_4608861 [Trichonephila clavipes]
MKNLVYETTVPSDEDFMDRISVAVDDMSHAKNIPEQTFLPAAESSDFARHLVLVLPHHTFNHVQTSSTLAIDD